MTNAVIIEEQVEIPLNLRSLHEFRRWALSECFPDRGRIDFIDGRIEVDMSPEDLFTHGTLKTEIAGVLWNCMSRGPKGYLFTDRARLSSLEAELSAEPDVMFVSKESLAGSRVRLVPKASGESGRYVELEGAADLVVEIVSDTSVKKDSQRLPERYYAAGVREFWLADARGEHLLFQIHRRGASAYEPVSPDSSGFQISEVFQNRFRLERCLDDNDLWEFHLHIA